MPTDGEGMEGRNTDGALIKRSPDPPRTPAAAQEQPMVSLDDILDEFGYTREELRKHPAYADNPSSTPAGGAGAAVKIEEVPPLEVIDGFAAEWDTESGCVYLSNGLGQALIASPDEIERLFLWFVEHNLT